MALSVVTCLCTLFLEHIIPITDCRHSKKLSYFQEVLADHDIQPGGDYSVKQIQDALTEGLGGQAFLNCERDNVLVEASTAN